jgi:hypothetical protein
MKIIGMGNLIKSELLGERKLSVSAQRVETQIIPRAGLGNIPTSSNQSIGMDDLIKSMASGKRGVNLALKGMA